MGEDLTREDDVEVTWRKYFVQLINGDKISEGGGNVRVRGRVRWNERVVRKVVREEVIGALKKTEGGKAAGMDSIAV